MRQQGIKKIGDGKVYTFTDYVSPIIQDVKANNYVLWGTNNDFYNHLRDLYLNSTTNNACINGIVKLVYGDGLNFDDPRKNIALDNVISPVEMRRLLLQFYVYNKWVAQVEYYMTDEGVRDVKKGIKKVFFLPAKDVAPAKKDEYGEVNTYYISKDWSKPRSKEGKPVPVPAFGCGSEQDEIEVYFWQLEIDNDEYFAPVTYQGCLQYAECEVETSNYHLNHILRGFAPSGIINFNNGVPTPDERRHITRDFVASKTGSENAGKAFITFNDSAENAVTIASYDIPDPHRQYEFIASISEKKILLSHNVSSPLLFGIRDTTGGLGSNANEIKESYEVMREMSLEPIRHGFLQGLEPLLLEMGIATPPTFSDLKIFDTTEVIEEVPQAQLHKHEHSEEPEGYSEKWMTALEKKGETISGDDEEWAELSETEVTDPENEANFTEMIMETTPPNGKPEDKSEGDSGLFKVRYRYGPETNNPDSRDLCKFLIQKRKEGVVYRKEDIDSWEDLGVNAQFAPEGKSKYSLWLWKGGAYCHHRWFRVIYFRKRNPNGSFKPKSTTAEMENDKKVSQPAARTAGLPEKKLNPPGWPDAGTAPIDQPNRGSLKNS